MKKKTIRVIALLAVLSAVICLCSCRQQVSVRFVDKDGNNLNLFGGVSVATVGGTSAPTETFVSSTETAQPAATESVPAATENSASQTTQPAATEAPTQATAPASTPTGNAELVSAVNKAMSTLKAEQNFKAQKTEKTVINIKECSISSLTNMLNSICKNVAGEKVVDYDFAGGQGVGNKSDGKQENDGNPKTVKEAIPPFGADFILKEEGVKSIKAEKSGDSTVYTIALVAESSTLDSAPPFNLTTVDYLNLGAFTIPTVTMTQGDINYPATVITMTVNAAGKVTAFNYDQPMDGTMGVKVAVINGSIDFDGGNFVKWTFTY